MWTTQALVSARRIGSASTHDLSIETSTASMACDVQPVRIP
jgi:hypothetical protein